MEIVMSDTEKAIKPEPEQDLQQDFEDVIRKRAFLMWELEGRPQGREDGYWHRARERIEAETHSAYPPAESGKHRT
jgi:hypothetical protein